MHEFEMRFKLDRDISGELANLGFKKAAEFDMCDIIFEPKTWNPGDDLKLGYFAIRMRLSDKKPKLEMKKYVAEDLWDEISADVESPMEMIKMLLEIMYLRRYVSKHRIVWKKNGLEACVDDVEFLGHFVEIEGSKEDVCDAASLLKLDISQKQPNYGAQLFYMERDGKITFSHDKIIKAAEKFIGRD